MIQEMSHLEKDRKNHKLRIDWRDIFTWCVTGVCAEGKVIWQIESMGIV